MTTKEHEGLFLNSQTRQRLVFFCYTIRMLSYQTVIVGAGASGLFCAGSFNAPKLLIDHNKRPGVKVGVSGGGKCNFTNRTVSAADYLSQRQHFCKNALAAFKPTDFIRLMDENQLPYEERSHGQLFATRAQDVVQLLVRRAQVAHTDFSLSTEVFDVQPQDEGFLVRTSRGTIAATRVVLACGGLSYPALGASQLGFKLAKQLGLAVVPPRPALCGLTLPNPWQETLKPLAGNSTLARVSTGKHSFTEQLLFTHEGFSGPAILPVSLFWQEGEPIRVNFAPHTDILSVWHAHKNTNRPLSAVVALPGKIARTLLGELDVPLANATRAQLLQAAQRLGNFTCIPARTAGYTKAEVTCGGIDTAQLNPHTFEVKKFPGLYVIGELLDVTGRLGGYNLHWAWASGFCAATNLGQPLIN